MRKRILVPSIFLVLLIIMSSVLMFFSNRSHNQNALRSLGYIASFNDGWYIEDGKNTRKINAQRLSYYADDEGKLSIYHPVHVSTQVQSTTLALHCANIAFELFIGDTSYYSYGIYNTVSDMSISPGQSWHFITLPPEVIDKTVRLDIKTFYNDGSEGLIESYYGQSAVILREIILRNILPFGICILLILLGISFIILHFILNNLLNIATNLVYMGLFIALMASWSLTHTSIPTFFLEDVPLLNLFESMIILLIPIVLQIHIERICTVHRKKLFMLSYLVLIVNFVVQLCLCSAGIYDFHIMSDKTHMATIFAYIVMLVTVVDNRKAEEESNSPSFYNTFFVFAFTVYVIAAITDIARAYISIVSDASALTRIALALLTIAASAKCLYEITSFARQNYVSNMVRSLAYHDALTGLGNRTSFTEALSETELEKRHHSTLAVFVFDVNYLKYVNDNFGHQQGDKLIISCAECISKVFASDCKLFRIGGDEFAVIYSGDTSSDELRSRINSFNDAVGLSNANKPGPFKLRVAVGVAFMNSSRNETMDELFKRADRIMYENKRAMKETDDVDTN